MKLSYYPGCSLEASAGIYDKSIKWVAKKLGVELKELPGWSCCGATSAHSLNERAAYLLAGKNLILAQKQGPELLAPCSACYQRFKIAEFQLLKEEDKNRELQSLSGELFKGELKILNILEFFKARLPELKKLIIKPFAGLRVIPYYGCLLNRIPRVKVSDDRANPVFMDELIEACGGKAVSWPCKTDCCGAAFGITAEQLYEKLTGRLLEQAEKYRGDLMVACCPFCQLNLEMLAWKKKQERPDYPALPVLFITQFLGLALGGDYKSLGLNALLVEPLSLKEQVKQ